MIFIYMDFLKVREYLIVSRAPDLRGLLWGIKSAIIMLLEVPWANSALPP